MDRTYVVSSLQYRPEPDPEPPTVVENLGLSLTQLMRLSGGEATGVRADLRINDLSARSELERYYSANTRLEWTFNAGGGGNAFTAVLRWTKFDPSSGRLQLVKTAVPRDLIADVDPTNGRDVEEDCRAKSTEPAPRERHKPKSSPPLA